MHKRNSLKLINEAYRHKTMMLKIFLMFFHSFIFRPIQLFFLSFASFEAFSSVISLLRVNVFYTALLNY